jgi:serine/threonine protein kinase
VDRAVLETSSDRYVIVEYLAEGGMGAIYLGKKLGVGGFEKEVVLKQLLPEFTREPKFIDLFLREARLSASLEHANIVHTIDLVNAGDDYFMVMEYVKGADLRTLLKRVRRRHQRFLPQAGVFIGHEILEALAYAHAKTANDGRPLSLIHRDISPSNILLSGAGEVKLTDFGIAKASTHRSVFYKVKGKVGYMSPEQARGEAVDARSDLFSLGVVLYEVLVGERLFVGDLMSSASQIYAQPIKAPSHKRPEIPPDLDTVILKALSLDPAGRFQSADEFQEALTRVATRHRLLIGASEMAGQLRQIAGEDAAQWLKLEVLPERGEPTQAHGTAVLTSPVDDYEEGEAEGSRSGFDLSDEEEEEEEEDESGADELVRARNRPPSLPTAEFTSVISVRSGDGESEKLTSVRRDEPPLQPLQPKRSEPIGAPSSVPRRSPVATPANDFGREESRSQTLVRDSSPRYQVPVTTEARAPKPSPSPRPQPAARSYESLRSYESRQYDPPPRTPEPSLAAQMAAAAAPGRRLPKSGIRERPRGPAFDQAAAAAVRARPRRIIGIMIVLLLIGIGVALGVAFSGPELEVVDPSLLPPAGTSPAPPSLPSASGKPSAPPGPTELPGPPAATPSTP